MKSLIVIAKNEFLHFIRSPFKITALILFMLAAIYGLYNGYTLYKTHQSQIKLIKEADETEVSETVALFDEGKTGPEGYPWIDITTPFWAIRNSPSSVFKEPSPLMVFSIGQTEQFGYYKDVSLWSSTFDNDLAEENANPERLALGTLDFSFVILFLLPILIIILLFNIGGLEIDLAFDKLIRMTYSSKIKWLFSRFLFYFILITLILFLLMLPFGILTTVFESKFTAFAKLFILILSYMFLWFGLFYFINFNGKGSSIQALKMVVVWLLICIINPGAVHQLSALKYPAGYMTDYIDASRDQANEIWELPVDTIYNKLLVLYPEIKDTKHAKDTILNMDIIDDSYSAVHNDLMKGAALTVEEKQSKKNEFITSTYWINPLSFFQNKMNAFAENDYTAYQAFRNDIQSIVDKKVYTLVFASWNKEIIDKNKYLEYVEYFKN